MIDQFSRLTPARGECVLEGDRHSFCGVRVHDLIDIEDGGTMRDSEGRVNQTGNFWDVDGKRKAPRWVDCTGNIGDSTVGMLLMGHPRNPLNEYCVQDWGLMEVSAMLDNDFSFTNAMPFRFAARYVAHDGELAAETADQLYAEFSKKRLLRSFGSGANSRFRIATKRRLLCRIKILERQRQRLQAAGRTA